MTIDAAGLDLLFREARSHNKWKDTPVSDETLQELYDLLKFGPTSANCSPARFVFVPDQGRQGQAGPRPVIRQPGKDHVSAGDRGSSPMIPSFYEKLPKLFPHNPSAADWFTSNDSLAATTAFRNGTLQGAYLTMAARSLGLDTGSMSGFDNAKVDAAFFAASGWRSNWLVNIGHGDPDGLFGRSPRLPFNEACLLA